MLNITLGVLRISTTDFIKCRKRKRNIKSKENRKGKNLMEKKGVFAHEKIIRLCLIFFWFAYIPSIGIADIDPAPYPAVFFESALEQYINCSWEAEGIAYFFTGTPYDSDIFAERYDGENYIFTIMTVMGGQVRNIMESSTAIFQEPVTEFYCEIYDEISISFESGSGMLYQKDVDQQWRLKSYTKCDKNNSSFTVSMFDGPITYYEYDNQLTGVYKTDRLCGYLRLDTAFSSVDFKDLPDSPDVLKNLITTKDSSGLYMMDSMDVEDISYYASCYIHEQKADIRIYAEGGIVRFDDDQPIRVIGFDTFVDGIYQGRTFQEHIAQYDFYRGNIDITVNFSSDSKTITIAPWWEDESTDLAYSFVFQIHE